MSQAERFRGVLDAPEGVRQLRAGPTEDLHQQSRFCKQPFSIRLQSRVFSRQRANPAPLISELENEIWQVSSHGSMRNILWVVQSRTSEVRNVCVLDSCRGR